MDLVCGTAGFDTPYGTWPLGTFGGNDILADGKIYVRAGHDYTAPVFKGAKLYCINATTGQEIFETLSFNVAGGPALADGYLVWDNGYDNQIYSYGKGPSKTTVSAPQIGVTTETPVTIIGTVTDISFGSQQNAVAANFPNGLPCVSDASMSQFMESVYQQQPVPHNMTGVPVTLSVVDANGNNRIIGTTTSDAYGTYSLTWTPDITGNYSLTATFAGSGGYYPSSASTAFYASNPAPTQAPTAAPATSVADTYFVPAIAGLFVLIIIVLALVALSMLRKHE
jgi:outer membrane protein assembly factor BamB